MVRKRHGRIGSSKPMSFWMRRHVRRTCVYFGAKLHVGVDAGSGYIHTTVVTAANVPDGALAHKLLRKDDNVMYGDSAFCAVEKHKEVQEDLHLSRIDYQANKQKSYRKYAWEEGAGTFWLWKLEYQKSRVRCKVEYVLHVINQVCFRGCRAVCLRYCTIICQKALPFPGTLEFAPDYVLY